MKLLLIITLILSLSADVSHQYWKEVSQNIINALLETSRMTFKVFNIKET